MGNAGVRPTNGQQRVRRFAYYSGELWLSLFLSLGFPLGDTFLAKIVSPFILILVPGFLHQSLSGVVFWLLLTLVMVFHVIYDTFFASAKVS